MIYQNIILTIFVALVFLLLFANVPTKKQVAKQIKENEEFKDYQIEQNELIKSIHYNMIHELREIKNKITNQDEV